LTTNLALAEQESIVMGAKEKLRKVNLALFYHFNTHKLHCPNTTSVFPWEADLVSLTRAELSHEFEIKITRADFKADFKKDKHRLLRDKFRGEIPYSITPERMEEIYAKWPTGSRDALTFLHRHEIKLIPNYFWFVCLDFDVPHHEIPVYAGYIKATSKDDYVYLSREKEAPCIHKGKLDDKQKESLYHSVNARYWKWAEGAYA